MNNSLVLPGPVSIVNIPTDRRKLWQRFELGVIALVLIALNWSMLHGVCNSQMIFLPGAFQEGEWWRLLTHPFVHVTWFHLLLDGAAFFLLYKDLQDHSFFKRASYFVATAIGSLLICLWADPMLSTKGLCGISGIAHGLMVVSALDLMTQRSDKALFRIGLCSLILVLAKCLIEVLTGKMLFTFIYFGMVGDPVAVTHAGGVLGALIAWLLFYQTEGRKAITTTS